MICRDLAHWARGESWDKLTPAVQEKMRLLLIDTLGCAVAGRDHPAAQKSARVAAGSFAGPPQATGLTSGAALTVFGAMLDSGAAIRALDLNDIYWGRASGGHPSDIFAAGLAIAEQQNASIGELLCAVAAGYELYIRIADVLQFRPIFDHTTATCMGAAMIAGCLRKLDEDAFAHGLAMAFASSPRLSILRRGHVSEVKAPAPAMAQVSGVLAMDLGAGGVTGPVDGIDGEFGVSVMFRPGTSVASLKPEEPSARVLDVAIKRYPCIGTGQSTVASAIALREKLSGRLDRVKSFHVRVADDDVARGQTGEVYRDPDNRETADHSLWSLFSMALVEGRLTPQMFAARRWKDADARAVVAKTTMAADLPGEESGRLSAAARAMLDDGTVVEVATDYTPGHPKNPLSVAGVEGKFREAVVPILGASKVEAALGAWRAATSATPVRTFLRNFF